MGETSKHSQNKFQKGRSKNEQSVGEENIFQRKRNPENAQRKDE
jgi:hypothetical protein